MVNTPTPSPKQRNRLVSNLRRAIATSSPSTNLPRSLPEKTFNQRINSNQIGSLENADLKSTPLSRVRDDDDDFLDSPPSHKTSRDIHPSSRTQDDGDSISPTSSGSSSSNLSSPLSHTALHRSIFQERRYASWFSKITYCTNKYVEDRYVYSKSPGEKSSSPDLISDPATDDTLQSTSFFSIPSTRQNLTKDLDWFFSDDQEEIITADQFDRFFSDRFPPKSPLSSAFVEVIDFDPSNPSLKRIPQATEVISDPIHQFLTSLSASLRSDPTEFSPHLSDLDRYPEERPVRVQDHDPRPLHPFLTQLDRPDPTPVRDSSDLPMVLKCSLARAKNVKRRKNPSSPIKVGGRASGRSPIKLENESEGTSSSDHSYALGTSNDDIFDDLARLSETLFETRTGIAL